MRQRTTQLRERRSPRRLGGDFYVMHSGVVRYCDPGLACTIGDLSFASGVSVPCSDGCNSRLCNAGSWTSTDRACAPLPKVEPYSGVEAGAPKARVLYLDGDALALEVGMGGCANTTPGFKLCFDGSFAESFPVQTRLRIVADEPSACSAWTTQERVCDLTPLRDAYRGAYQISSGAISVGLPGDSVVYMFESWISRLDAAATA